VSRADALLAGGIVVGVAAVAAALVSQHVFDMQPCPWCVLQRLIFLAVAVACVVGLAWRSVTGRRVGAGLALLFAACGVGAALWQHFVAAGSASCNLSAAERIISALKLDEQLPAVFMPMASCADAAVRLAGVPYEFWSLALFVVLGAVALSVLRRPA
jgi:disulfide bond formation protein DsbB